MNAPWFKFFAGDYLNDPDVDDLSEEAQGVLVKMWCGLWLHESLPGDDLVELARKCKVRLPAMQKHSQNLMPFFVRHSDGRLTSDRMDQERKYSGIVSKARHQAAKKRWNKGVDAIAYANSLANQSANANAKSIDVRGQRSDVRSRGSESPKTSCGTPSQTDGVPPQLVALITLPLNDGSEYSIVQSDASTWQTLFPALDVIQELRSMRSWCLANSQNRKTRRGIQRFVNGWLQKAQNRAPVKFATPVIERPNPPATSEWNLPFGVDVDLKAGAQLWDATLKKVAQRVKDVSFASWFQPTVGHGLRGNCLIVRVPSADFLQISNKYGALLREFLPAGLEVEFVAPKEVSVA